MPGLAYFLAAAALIAIYFFNTLAARERRRAMEEAAARLGLRFSPGRDRKLARRFKFLDQLRRGSNRYAFNTLSGDWKGHRIVTGDFHYQDRTATRRETRHYYFSFFILLLPLRFPELIIGRENFISRIVDGFWGSGINFESAEFSRKFRVRSRDKKFAYDVCHPRMIEYLLANDDLAIEIENTALALTFEGRLAPDRIGPNLDRLVEVRELLPGYLFSRPAKNRPPRTGVDRGAGGRIQWNPLGL